MKDTNTYKKEVKEKWGQTNSYNEYIEKTKNYTEDKINILNKIMNNIFKEFAICMKNCEIENSNNVQKLVELLQNHINKNYYSCTKDILLELGKMYVSDERFKKNIDKHAIGTAEYVSRAIEFYCKK